MCPFHSTFPKRPFTRIPNAQGRSPYPLSSRLLVDHERCRHGAGYGPRSRLEAVREFGAGNGSNSGEKSASVQYPFTLLFTASLFLSLLLPAYFNKPSPQITSYMPSISNIQEKEKKLQENDNVECGGIWKYMKFSKI